MSHSVNLVYRLQSGLDHMLVKSQSIRDGANILYPSTSSQEPQNKEVSSACLLHLLMIVLENNIKVCLIPHYLREKSSNEK